MIAYRDHPYDNRSDEGESRDTTSERAVHLPTLRRELRLSE